MRYERIHRFWLVPCIGLVLLLFCGSARSLNEPLAFAAQPNTPFALPDETEPWETRFLHSYRASVQLPASWRLHDMRDTFYDSSWVRGLVLRLPNQDMQGQPLQDVCQDAAIRFFEVHTIKFIELAGGHACIIESPEREWSQAVIRRPASYVSLYSGEIDTLWWFAHRDVMRRILLSLSFDPPSPELYLSEALHVLEENFVFTDEVDWNAARAEALATLDAASTYEQAHSALMTVFDEYLGPLDHGHSAFLLPADTLGDREGRSLDTGIRTLVIGPTGELVIILVYPGSPGDRAGLKLGDVLTLINGQTFADYDREIQEHPPSSMENTFTYQVTRPGQPGSFDVEITMEEYDFILPVNGRRLDDNIAYVETFSVSSLTDEADTAYATAAHATIAGLDNPAACGWIVDVRRNWGGAERAMALAVAPLWGEGDFLRAMDVRRIVYAHRYEGGRIIEPEMPQETGVVVEQPYRLQNQSAPVAVLTSNITASMGEVTVRALINRPAGVTRIFGERTAGLDNTLVWFSTLSDNARMDYSYVMLLDSQRDAIREPIEPDVPMKTDYAVYGTDDDPLIQAARDWLLTQPECSSPS